MSVSQRFSLTVVLQQCNIFVFHMSQEDAGIEDGWMEVACFGLVFVFFRCCLELLHTEQTAFHYEQRIRCLETTQEMRENKYIINVCDCASP